MNTVTAQDRTTDAASTTAAATATAARTATATAIEITGLTVEYSVDTRVVRPLDGLDLSIREGEFVCFLGPSGQGKSTLLRCIAGLQPATAGTVSTADGPVTGPGAERGMVFQQDAIPLWMRVEDNVAFGPRSRRVPREQYQERVDHFLTEVGLGDWRRAWPRQLSGGMRKRVSIAAVFANDPDVLLMDEPFGALDYFTRERLQLLLLRLWEETSKTVCFVTHDVDEALALATRVVVLGGGGVALDIAVELPQPRGAGLRTDPAAIELRELLLRQLERG